MIEENLLPDETLIKRAELYQRLEKVIEDIRSRNRLSTIFTFLPNSSNRFDQLAAESIDLQKQIVNSHGSPNTIFETKKRVVELEIDYQKLSAKLVPK